uniref:mucin-5AC-like n=1 Tax=Styela clava TaxID=7725 RepID=UPI001939DFD2|nr:mucin-5AC-like [Styela clava]
MLNFVDVIVTPALFATRTNNILDLLLFYLNIYLSSTGEKCWAPMLCNNTLAWRVFGECEMNEEFRNRKKALEEHINQLASMLTLLEGKLKTKTAMTTQNNIIHTSTTDVKETTKPQEFASVKSSSITATTGPAESPWTTRETFFSTVNGVKTSSVPASSSSAKVTTPEDTVIPQTISEPAVQTTSEPSVQTTSQPSVQTTSQPSVQTTSEPAVRTTSGPAVQTTSESAVQTTSGPAVQTTSEPAVQTTSGPAVQTTSESAVQTTSQPSVQTTSQPSVQTTSEPAVQTTSGPAVQTTSESAVQSTSESAVQSTSKPAVQTTSEPAVQTTSEPAVQTTSEPAVQTTSEPAVQTTSGPAVQTTSEPAVQTTSEPAVQTTSEPAVQTTSEPAVQTTSESAVQSTSKPAVQTTSEPSVQTTSEPSAQTTSEPAFQTTPEPAVQTISSRFTEEVIMRYDGKVFIPLASEEVYKASAIVKCQQLGAELANIYNQDHMDKIMAFIRDNKMGGHSWKLFHLGMTYDPINQILRLRNETEISSISFKWSNGFPLNGQNHSGYTNMLIDIRKDTTNSDQHIYNYLDNKSYVLCEI